MIRIVFNKLLNGWYVTRGAHLTPISGRFNTEREAQDWIDSRNRRRG